MQRELRTSKTPHSIALPLQPTRQHSLSLTSFSARGYSVDQCSRSRKEASWRRLLLFASLKGKGLVISKPLLPKMRYPNTIGDNSSAGKSTKVDCRQEARSCFGSQ